MDDLVGRLVPDPERVAAALERLELVYCEMEPGTGLFFHANLLHMSAQNRGDKSRWSFICSYNAARNNPYKDSHNPRYTFNQKTTRPLWANVSRPDRFTHCVSDPYSDEG